MSNKQILEKAIQKAIDGGWELKFHGSTLWNARELSNYIVEFPYQHPIEALIFNHDFAKALWGEDTLSPEYGDMEKLSAPDLLWQFHLQNMVISDDPIKYLGDNI
jgi:hypothetical protein